MKKNMFKVITSVFISICLMLGGIKELNAASAYISVRSSNSRVVVGNSFTVTVNVSSSVALGSWEYNMSYDSSVVKLTGGQATIVDYGNGSKKEVSYSYTFKAIASGSTNIGVKNYAGYDWDMNAFSMSAGSASVTAITQAQLEASYSKDNTLSSLSVEGATLNPAFSKTTYNYTVDLDSNTEKINVLAAVSDRYASLVGTGEIEVSEGENKIEVVVTAENGSKQTYTIVANVKDSNPIIAKTTDNKSMTIVKREKNLVIPSNTYTSKKVTIDGVEVPGFYSETTGYTLVGLKDENGNINLYIYDSVKKTYQLYQEIKFANLIIFANETDIVPEGYSKFKTKINDTEVNVYKINENDEFSLLYGTNIETGESHMYQYDSVENTVSRYNNQEINSLNDRLEKYFTIIIFLGGETIFLLLLLMIILLRKTKKRNYIALSKKENNNNNIKVSKIEVKDINDKQEEKTLNKTNKIDKNELEKKLSKKELKKLKKKNKKNLSDTQKLEDL